MRVFDGVNYWDDFDSALGTRLPPNFKMLEIKRYTGRSCSLVQLRLYTIVIRAYRRDKAQMLLLFPVSLSSVA